jgi:hypothetical protein
MRGAENHSSFQFSAPLVVSQLPAFLDERESGAGYKSMADRPA